MGKKRVDWKIVYEVIRKNRSLIEGAIDIRESYYLTEGLLAEELRKKGIKPEMHPTYRRLRKPEGYNYYRDDLWPRLEREGLNRPPVKPIGFVLWSDLYYEMERVGKILIESAVAVIYVEKASTAKRIKPLSLMGYVIMAGQGFPTRMMRSLAKKSKLLVLHDADKSGYDMYRVFVEGAVRLKRVSESLALKFIVQHAIDLGLTIEDAEKLGLTPEPASERDKRAGWSVRYELQALAKLQLPPYNIQNPWLAYVIHKLKELGFPLAPAPPEYREAYRQAIYFILTRKLDDLINNIAREVADTMSPTGYAEDYMLDKSLLEQMVDIAKSKFLEKIEETLKEITITESDLKVAPSILGVKAKSKEEYAEKLFEVSGAKRIAELLGH